MSKQRSSSSSFKGSPLVKRAVSPGFLFPLTKKLSAVKGSRSKTDQTDGTQIKLAPLTVPEDAKPLLKLYAERYYNSIKTDPDNVNNIYNTACFLVLSLLDSSLDESICRFLDAFAPIANIKTHMDLFDDDIGIAMQRHRDLATILNHWQLAALRRYEFLKGHLITVRRAELFLFFQRDQRSGFIKNLNRIMDKPYRVIQLNSNQPSQSNSSSKLNQNFEIPDIMCSLKMNNDIVNLPLDEATFIVTSEKRKLEIQVENFSLYLRCIRELIQINENNMAKIHSYQFRWRPTRLAERVQGKRLNLNPPLSELHKTFLDLHKSL